MSRQAPSAFISSSSYQRFPFLGSARARVRFLGILVQTHERCPFLVVGYVVMLEHVHLLISEPEMGSPPTVMQGTEPADGVGVAVGE